MKKYNDFVKLNELLAITPIDEQLADSATNKKVKEMLLDIAKEEKTHVGEFQELLKELDPEYKEELKKGKEEYKESKEDEEDEEEKDKKDDDKKDETVQK